MLNLLNIENARRLLRNGIELHDPNFDQNSFNEEVENAVKVFLETLRNNPRVKSIDAYPFSITIKDNVKKE